MKILLTMQQPYFPAFGGANKCNRLLAEALVKKRHTVQVIVPAINASSHLTYSQFRSELETRHIRVNSRGGVDIFNLNDVEVHALAEPSHVRRHLIDQIDKFEPDWILISCEEWSQGLLDAALKAAPSRVIYLVHTLLFLPFGPQAFFPSPVRTKLLEKVAAIVVDSNFAHDYIEKWSGLESTIFYWPAYGSGPFSDFGCFEDGFVTLVNPSVGKGIEVFIALARRQPEVQFAAVPTWGTTSRDRLALGSVPNVHLLEPREDFDQILAQTRVLLMPSLWQEPFPLTVVEAMLHGIPVLASNTGGLPEAKLGTDFVLPVRPIEGFTEQLDDRLIPAPIVPEQSTDDIDQWCDALRLLLSDRTLYEKQSAAARDSALGFVSGLSFDPFEDLVSRLPTERNGNRLKSRLKLKHQDSLSTADKTDSLSAKLEGLTPEQRGLLIQWLQTDESFKPGESVEPLSVCPVKREDPLPLSFAQQRLWFLEQLAPGTSAYNIHQGFRLNGRLNVRALEQSFNEIIRRHEVLRTTFPAEDGQPVQMIAPALTLTLPLVNLTGFPKTQREAEVHRLANKEAQLPFDLARSPLLRSTLLQLSDDEHVLLLTLHHIVSDGWSMRVFFRELTALYEAFCKGIRSPLPELPIQYADFAVWQRQWLQAEVLESQLSYWKEQLGGAPPALDLPTDRPRPAVQTFRGARRPLRLPKALSEKLRELSQREGVTVFMTLLAAFQSLLHRYTGQDSVLVGSPIANRTRPEIEGLIGFFSNTLVLRAVFSGNPTFLELLALVREVCLGAYDQQDLPFEKLVENLQPERDLSRNPLFQVMFQLRSVASQAVELPGITVEASEFDIEIAKFDLTLSMVDEGENLRGWLEYNTDLFEASTIERMLGHFQVLLRDIVDNPELPIGRLSLLTEAEQHQLVIEWNAAKTDYPRNQSIHHLFEEQVDRTPKSVAVSFEDQKLTYGQLNARANQLAQYLRKLAVGPEVLVGLCMERSLNMVVGLLGILKAGGAYVPLDPEYPKERLAFMLEDTHAPVLLSQHGLLENLPVHNARVVCLDRDWAVIRQESQENFESGVTGKNLAYAIYTSGSTGKPKGVAIQHSSPVAFLSWVHTIFPPEHLAGVLASTSICFDLSVFELLAPLTCGGQVILAENALALPGLPTRSEVTLINTVPSAIAELVQLNRIPPSVLTVNLAGEPLSTRLVQQIYATTSVKHVYDLYGPSEDTTYSTVALRTREGPQTIGRPISNTQIYILDGNLNPVPVGISGELHISGKGLARGYLNRPDLTAEKFIPNPLSSEPSTCLYRTGDLARYLPDGNIEFLGRIDHQIKLRGFRIELGEIEAVLSSYDGVADTVVLAREDVAGDKQLVAYIVLNKEGAPTTQDLRNYLKQKLPGYMVPSAFVFLESLPVTPNGKVDRIALPLPDQSRPELEENYVAPRTSIEEALAGIWAEILKLERVGIHDNFFDLGGHSLLATQVISRVRRAFQVEIPLRAMFEKPTVEELAIAIMERQAEGVQEEQVSRILAGVESLSEEETRRHLVEQDK